jgi:uncharacterized protein (TIGR02453 family)
MPETFEGFPKEGLKFLSDLGKDNSVVWFHAHKPDYEKYLKAPGLAFVQDMTAALSRSAKCQVDGKLSRPNRDIRFSADKRPYKEYVDVFLRENGGNCGHSGYYFHLEPARLVLGAGTHEFDDQTLTAYRKAVVDAKKGAALAGIASKLESKGYKIGGRHYKKVPIGFDPAHPRAEWLKHNAIHAGLEMKLPKEVHSARFIDFCLNHYKNLRPLHEWLVAL